MTDTNQQTPLPTLRPGDSHAESLIESAIQGHASTREAMRWLVRQLMPMQALAQVQGDSSSVTYGCHCDLEPGMKPDGCVLDYGNPNDCVHARGISNREECNEWRPIHITTPQPASAQVLGEPFAWVEHHKGGDNLVWGEPGGRKSPLYATPQPAQATQAEVTLLTNMLESAQKEAQRLQKEVDRPQPRADVTDEQIIAAYLAWCKTSGTPESFARAILALRPSTAPDLSCKSVQARLAAQWGYVRHAAVPMTNAALTERARIVDLIEGRACKSSCPHRLTLELNQLAEVIKSGLGWLEYERYKHNGIPAQAKKEGV